MGYRNYAILVWRGYLFHILVELAGYVSITAQPAKPLHILVQGWPPPLEEKETGCNAHLPAVMYLTNNGTANVWSSQLHRRRWGFPSAEAGMFYTALLPSCGGKAVKTRGCHTLHIIYNTG